VSGASWKRETLGLQDLPEPSRNAGQFESIAIIEARKLFFCLQRR
jgi:hypothetical protein